MTTPPFHLLLSIACADACGAGREFAPREFIDAHSGLDYVQNPVYPALLPGRYTDDTQMSIAVSEWMLAAREAGPAWLRGRPEEIRRVIADWFVLGYRRDPRPGYSRALGTILERPDCTDGTQLLGRVRGGSGQAGAAMRTVPCGLLTDLKDVQRATWLHGFVTHGPVGVGAAQAVAFAAHRAYDGGGPRSEVLQGLRVLDQAPDSSAHPGWEHSTEDLVREALTLAAASRSLSEVLQQAIAAGGDTDTRAAIAVGVASLFPDAEHDLPEALIEGLENGSYGADYLRHLDERLQAAFPR